MAGTSCAGPLPLDAMHRPVQGPPCTLDAQTQRHTLVCRQSHLRPQPSTTDSNQGPAGALLIPTAAAHAGLPTEPLAPTEPSTTDSNQGPAGALLIPTAAPHAGLPAEPLAPTELSMTGSNQGPAGAFLSPTAAAHAGHDSSTLPGHIRPQKKVVRAVPARPHKAHQQKSADHGPCQSTNRPMAAPV